MSAHEWPLLRCPPTPANAWFDQAVLEPLIWESKEKLVECSAEQVQKLSGFQFKSHFLWDHVLSEKQDHQTTGDSTYVSHFRVQLFDRTGELRTVEVSLPLAVETDIDEPPQLLDPTSLESIWAKKLGTATGLAYNGKSTRELEQSEWLSALPFAFLVESARRSELVDQRYLYEAFPVNAKGELTDPNSHIKGKRVPLKAKRPARRRAKARPKARPNKKRKKKRSKCRKK